MYCPQCNCEYTGWNQKCPVCQTRLVEVKPEVTKIDSDLVDYAALVDAVREHGGTLTIEMKATDIETKRGRGFPYVGRGYAWANQFEGVNDDFSARLTTTEVGRSRKWTFPFFGYGFAWEKEMGGSVNGNPLTLKAEKVARESKMAFPYRGYGRAWVQEMSGECGEKLAAVLTITEVQKRKKWAFPYSGFGFAWANAGQLTLTLVE